MENVEQQTTLRDDILASIDSVDGGGAVVDAPEVVTESSPTETEAQKAERARDEAGRFAKTSAPQAKPTSETPSSDSQPPAPVVAEPPVAKTPRPSSWKKDFDPQWDTFAPEVQKYILQREADYAKGVSTYKHEADSARELNSAMAEFMPDLQQHNIKPTEWIRNLGTAHKMLATGSPQEKVMMGVKLVRDYGIDPQQLFNVLSGQQQYQAPQPRQAPAPQPDIRQTVTQILEEQRINDEFNRFVGEAPQKYPHYEAVKDTMAGLLQAGLAQDYESAYEAAIRHPRHSDIYEQEQQQRLQSEQAAQAAQRQAVATNARSKAVSVKSSTPSGTMTQAKGDKSLRDELASSFDTVTTGRV